MMPGRSIKVRSGHSGEKTTDRIDFTLELDGVVNDTFFGTSDLIGQLLDLESDLVEVCVFNGGLDREDAVRLGFSCIKLTGTVVDVDESKFERPASHNSGASGQEVHSDDVLEQ